MPQIIKDTIGGGKKYGCNRGVVLSLAMAVHRQGECWIFPPLLTGANGNGNGGRHKAMPLPSRDGAQSPCRVSPPANSYIRGQLPSATDCATVWQHAGTASPGMHTGGYFGYQTASLDPGHC